VIIDLCRFSARLTSPVQECRTRIDRELRCV